MPKRDPDLLVADMLVADMLESLRRIDLYTAGTDRDSFLQDEKTIDAVVRNLEVLGEAARQLPDDFTARHPRLARVRKNHVVYGPGLK